MNASTPGRGKTGVSLERRIDAAGESLAAHRAAAAIHAGQTVRGLRAALGSPLAVLAAGGIGFAAGLYRPCAAAPDAGPESRSPGPSLIALLLDGFSVVTTVLALVPALRPVAVPPDEAPDRSR